MEDVMVSGTPLDLLAKPFLTPINNAFLSDIFYSIVVCLGTVLSWYGNEPLISRPPRPVLDKLVPILKATLKNYMEECQPSTGIPDLVERGITLYEKRSGFVPTISSDKVVEYLRAFSDPKWTLTFEENREFDEMLSSMVYYMNEVSGSGKSSAELLPMAREYFKFCDSLWPKKQFPEWTRAGTFATFMELIFYIVYRYGMSKACPRVIYMAPSNHRDVSRRLPER